MIQLRNCGLFCFFTLLLFFTPIHNSFVNADTIYGTPGNDIITVPASTIYHGIFGYEGDDVIFIESGAAVVNDVQVAAEAIADAASVAIDAGSGDDQVTNNGTVSANADAEALPADGTASQATANAKGISAGDGADMVQNSSEIAVTSNATATTEDMILTAAGDGSVASGTSATASASGISSDAGGNTITNNDTITATADAEANAQSFELQIVDKASVDAGVSAEAKVIGILSADSDDNGVGRTDTLINSGAMTTSARAEADNLDLRAQIMDWSVADATSSAKAEAIGIKTGPRASSVINQGTAASIATAESDLWTVELNITDWGLAASGLTVESNATGIEGNDRADQIVNTGTITARATSEADKVGINFTFVDFTIGPGAWGELLGSSAGSADTLSKATAEGISGKAGDDIISNTGTVISTATSSLTGTAVSIGAEGIPKSLIDVLQGSSLASSSPKAETASIGIRGGDGKDTITNSGSIVVDATSTADDIGVNLSLPILEPAMNMPSPAFALGGAGVTALSEATGIEGGTGDDVIIHQEGLVDVNATSETLAVTASVGIQGVFDDIDIMDLQASVADASIKSESMATGINGGEGSDTIIVSSTGTLTSDATATADGVSVSVGVQGKIKNALNIGASMARADTKAIATAAGIEDGKGENNIYNAGTVTASADPSALSVDVSVETQLSVKKSASVSAAITDASTQAQATAKGISGGESDETITNSGKIVATATPDSTSTSVSVDVQKVEQSLAVGVSYADATTTADATAVGMSGDSGSDTLTNSSSGDIEVTSDPTGTSTRVGVTLEGSFSQEWTAVVGGSMTDGTTKAISRAGGIRGGDGDDTINNPGKVTVKTNPDAVSTSVSATLTGAKDGLTVGFTYADATTTAQGTAVGLSGDEGGDMITNESTGEIDVTATPTSTSTRVDVTVSGVSKGTGIVGSAALSDGTTKAIGDAAGIKGGDGDDTITNEGKITVKANPDAHSTGVVVDIGGALGELGLVGGFTYADAETTARATAVGIDGGAGSDTITNSGEMAVTAASTSSSTNVGVTAQVVTGMGAVLGGAITDGTTKAISSAAGINGGDGDDKITNSYGITATSTAHTISNNVSVNLSAAKEGVVAGFTYADATTSAEANAVGIGDDGGGGTIFQKGAIIARATAETDSNIISVDAGGTKMGLAAGVSLADATSGSIARSHGIDTGDASAANHIENSGYVISSSTADTSAMSMSLEFKAAMQGVTAGVSAARGEVTADAVTAAVRTGSGNDVIQNKGPLGLIYGTSTATSNSEVVAVTVTGSLKGLALGASLADGSTEAEATAMGIDSGAGRDTVVNDAAVVAAATANVESTNVAVTVAVTHPLKGVSAGVAISNQKTDATASAKGISGGDGEDEVINKNWLDVDAMATTKTKQITLNFAEVGMAKADLSSTADAQATGVSGGAGTDTIGNEGTIDVTAISVADDTQGVANFVGFASGDVDSLATATAIGIDAAGGTDGVADGNTVNNKSTGSITTLAHAKGVADQYVVQGGGAAFAKAGMEVSSNATGIVGDLGGDSILNEGTTNVTAWSEADATSFNFQLFGVQIGSAGINATATASGVDALDGQNSVINSTTGSLNVYADADTFSGSVIGGFSAGIVSSGTTAEAFSRGVWTGNQEDNIENDGSINVTAKSLGEAGAGAIGLAALSIANSLAAVTVEGINAGGGADTITNRGSMTVGAVRTGDEALVKADTEAIAFDYFSFVLSSLGAKGLVTGITAGGGDDIILNSGTLTVGDNDQWMVIGESLGFGGQIAGSASAHAGSTADIAAQGMDGGFGNDTLVNTSTGQVTVDARSYSEVYSETYETFGFLLPATADSDAHGIASATGIQGGAGNDLIDNAGFVGVHAYSRADAESIADMPVGIESSPFAESDAKAEANAVGIDTGLGSNLFQNSGSLDALGTAIAVSDAFSDSDTLRTYADAYARSVATVAGIQGGDGGNAVYNMASGTITANAMARTFDEQVNITRADTDEEATAVAGAWNGQTQKWLPVTGDAVGILLGDGDDTVVNDGTITVGSQSHGLVYAGTSSNARNTISEARAVVAAKAKGIAAGGGENCVTNNSQITVSAWGNGFASSDAWSRDYRATANSIADASAVSTGIEGDGAITNTLEGSINVTARATTYALTDTEAETATATADLTATATGIATASTAAREEPDHVRNDGNITVTALAGEDWSGNPQTIALADTDVWVRDASAEATGTSMVEATGITVGDGDAEIVNSGTIEVLAREYAHLSVNAFSRDYNPDPEATSTGNASVVGIKGEDGTNRVVNMFGGKLLLNADANAYAGSIGDTDGPRYAWADSTATANAAGDGVRVGAGSNLIINSGDIGLTAKATAETYSSADAGISSTGRAESTSTAESVAIGIRTGGGENEILNTGEIAVKAWAVADAYAYADADGGVGEKEVPITTASTDAKAYGISAGDGNNVIINKGTIVVTAQTETTAVQETEDDGAWTGTRLMSESATGVQTGNGDDVIINVGTISATMVRNGISSPGSGIDTGAGDDAVSLLDHSVVEGQIVHGDGNDMLLLSGSPLVTGQITGGTGNDLLVFDGAGSVNTPISEFETAAKFGRGTFTVNGLAQVKRIEAIEGTLEIEHEYQMASDGNFQAQVNGDGTHGQLKVNGTADLAGDLNVVKSPGLYRNGTRYDILVANDVNGVFGSEGLPEDTMLLSFRANTYSDRVEVETIAKSCTFVARNPVEMAIAQYLDKIMPMSSGDLWRVLGEFQSLSEKEFRRAFKSFSPDAYDNATRASYFATKEYTDTLQKRMNTLRSSFIIPGAQPRAESKKEPVRLAYNGANIGDLLGTREQVEAERRWALWIDGFGQWGDQDPEIGFAGFDYSVYGGAVGLDYMVQNKFIFGAGFGYSFSDIDLGDNQGDGDIKSLFGSLYGSYFTERAYVETVLSYGKQNYDNVRNIVIGPIQRRAYSEHDGDLFSAYLGGGYYFPVRDWRWGPFGSLLYTYLDEDGFQESGAGSLNLALEPRSTEGLISRLGLRVGRVFRTKGVNLIPELSLAWLYDFDIDDRVITSSIAGAPGIWFSVPGQPVERHGAVLGAGITLISGSGFRASLKYGGEFRDTYTAHALLGEVRFLF